MRGGTPTVSGGDPLGCASLPGAIWLVGPIMPVSHPDSDQPTAKNPAEDRTLVEGTEPMPTTGSLSG